MHLLYDTCEHVGAEESATWEYNIHHKCRSAYLYAPDQRGADLWEGNALGRKVSSPCHSILQMILVLLQELLMALRANDAESYKGWLAVGIEQLGRDVAGEVESDWMVQFLVEAERDRLMAWQLGVSL